MTGRITPVIALADPSSAFPTTGDRRLVDNPASNSAKKGCDPRGGEMLLL